MIFVCISDLGFEEAKAICKQYTYVELRLDLISFTDEQLQELCTINKNMLITIKGLQTFRYASILNYKYIDVDINIDNSAFRILKNCAIKRDARIIRSCHFEKGEWSKELMEKYCQKAIYDGGSYMKFVAPIDDPKEREEFLHAMESFRITAFCSGEQSLESRKFAVANNSRICYAAPDGFRGTEDTQPAFSDLAPYEIDNMKGNIKVNSTSSVLGQLNINSSKSLTQRYLLAAFLSGEVCEYHNLDFSDDSITMLQAVTKMGLQIEELDEGIKVLGVETTDFTSLHCGESGLASKLLLATAATFDKEITLTAEGSLLDRPIQQEIDALQKLGATITTTPDSVWPIKVKGPLNSKSIVINGNTTSQHLSALLFVLPLLNAKSQVFVKKLKSRPYVDLTVKILKDFGVIINEPVGNKFIVKGQQAYTPQIDSMFFENDWSTAANFFVAAAMCGEVTIKNMNVNSLQGDMVILKILDQVGAKVDIVEKGDSLADVKVRKRFLMPFEFDATNCPDLIPILTVLATACDGVSFIKGSSRLIDKESNRAKGIYDNFSKLSIKCNVRGDHIKIKGGKPQSGVYNSQNDHRMFMAGCVLALLAKDGMIVEGKDSVTKSCPDFIPLLRSLNVNIDE